MIPGFQECVLNNHRYSIHEMFHPVVEVNGTALEAVCFECVCLPVSAPRLHTIKSRVNCFAHARSCSFVYVSVLHVYSV